MSNTKYTNVASKLRSQINNDMTKINSAIKNNTMTNSNVNATSKTVKKISLSVHNQEKAFKTERAPLYKIIAKTPPSTIPPIAKMNAELNLLRKNVANFKNSTAKYAEKRKQELNKKARNARTLKLQRVKNDLTKLKVKVDGN